MSRLHDFIEPMRDPNNWIGAIGIVVLLTVPTGLMDKLNGTPRNTEASQAAAMERDQREEDQRRQHAKQCLEERGAGAVPLFDANGAFTGCRGRWGKS